MNATVATIGIAIAGLRQRRGRSAMCVVGIAAGVALSVTAHIQTTSVTEGHERTERAVVGVASIEAVARGPVGMPVSVFRAVARLPSVQAVAPITVQDVALEGPRGRATVALLGVDRRMRELGSSLASTIHGLLEARDVGVYLPVHLARRLGLAPGDRLTVIGPAGRRETLVSATPSRVGDQDIGSAPIAVAPLGLAQTLTGQGGRLTRLLIKESGHTDADRRALRAAVGPRGELRSPGWQSGLLAQASQLFRLTTNLFSALCLLLGAIVVYAVTLLAAVDRRREIATLAALGCAPARLIGVLVCEAVVLGVAGGVTGTVLGWGLVHALGPLPSDHLSFAFTTSDPLQLDRFTALAGVLAGIAVSIGATILASAKLAFDAPASALSMQREDPRSPVSRLNSFAGATAWVVAGFVTLIAPKLGAVTLCLVVAGAVLLAPALLTVLLQIIGAALPRPAGAGSLGISEIRHSPNRGAAIAAIVVVVAVGIIAINSSDLNLGRSADAVAESTFSYTDLWATVVDNDAWLSRTMSPAARGVLRAQPGVAHVRSHRSVFLDWQNRRILVYAYDTLATNSNLRVDADGRLLDRNVARSLGEGTAMLISRELAEAHRVGLGDNLTVPTPSGPQRLEIVGYVSNYGWQPGILGLSSAAIRRWWHEPTLTGLEIYVTAGTPAAAVRKRLQAIAAPLGVEIDFPSQLRQRVRDTTNAGLVPLRRIAWLLTLLAPLALTASFVAAIMQRARRIATLRAIGMQDRQVLASLTAEFAAITLAGTLAGLAGGLVAHRLVLRYLETAHGYPVVYGVEPTALGLAVGFCAAAALVVPLVSLRWLSKTRVRNSFADA